MLILAVRKYQFQDGTFKEQDRYLTWWYGSDRVLQAQGANNVDLEVVTNTNRLARYENHQSLYRILFSKTAPSISASLSGTCPYPHWCVNYLHFASDDRVENLRYVYADSNLSSLKSSQFKLV
jgi:hypothetical protein